MLDLTALNPPQRQAVSHTEGPLLILAGAGSGKTRVITYRLAHLLLNKKVPAQHLLAVTFTNKAAQEMQERLKHLAGPAAQKATISTFHSLGVRILRQQAAAAGYRRNFVIYDQHDQLTLVREIVKDRALDFAGHNAFELLGRISSAKNQGESPETFANQPNAEEMLFGDLYAHYLERTRNCNAIDFDDILLLVTKLLEQHPEVRRHYQEQFRYLMVDEYQDTNSLQYRFITLLLGEHRNLCVVGDDDQAIYSWRGANPEILLRFEEHFPGARLVKLEQNYRSTQVILHAANAVIKNNRRRKAKELWSALSGGARLRILTAENENEEAEKVAGAITMRKLLDPKVRFSDFAVLVRTNFQLRPLEEAARNANLPYQLIGGTSFYERPEIRTLIAYLKVMRNPDDELSLKRALDFPKRGIGATTLLRLHQYCQQHNCNLYRAFQEAQQVGEVRSAALHAIQTFVHLIEDFRRRFRHEKLSQATQELVAQTAYLKALEETTADAKSREVKVNNVREFLGSLQRFEQTSEDPTLAGFLDRVSLISDSDYLNEKVDRAIFLTMHAAKGLEFPYVFLFGMNDGQFPSSRALESGAIEEERRLCYVAITRAQRELTLSYSTRKTRYKEVLELQPSRFIQEIPAAVLENGGTESREQAAQRVAEEQEDLVAMLRRLRENNFKV